MKKILVALAGVVLLAGSVLAGGPALSRSNLDSMWLINGGAVQKSSKWPVGGYWWEQKGLNVRLNDTAGVHTDSCGVQIDLWGFFRNRDTRDSARVAFTGISNILKIIGKTANKSGAGTSYLDTSIVVADSATSALIDGSADMVQFAPICCYDSLQAYLYPNSWTKKASAVKAWLGLQQIDPAQQK